MAELKKVIDYCVPVNPDQETLDKKNKEWGTNFRTTDDHANELLDILWKAIDEVGDAGGWMIGDAINVKIELEYEYEDK